MDPRLATAGTQPAAIAPLSLRGDEGRLPFPLNRLVNLWWPLKLRILTNPMAWRVFAGVCRRIGWNESRLGWYTASNGPYAGIRLHASHVNLLWLPMGGYEPWVTMLLIRLLTDPKWGCAGKEIWDVGAYRGYFALLCRRYSSGRVTCFEPDPANRQELLLHLRENPRLSAEIDVVPSAVTDKDEPVEFISREAGLESQVKCAGVRLHEGESGGAKSTSVPGVRLDSLLQQGRPAPGLVKIDVEGAEALAIQGAADLIRKHWPVFLVEIHNEEAYHASLMLLKNAGYTIFWLDGKYLRQLPRAITYGHIVALHA
jgi:FkbM family methyltransferase